MVQKGLKDWGTTSGRSSEGKISQARPLILDASILQINPKLPDGHSVRGNGAALNVRMPHGREFQRYQLSPDLLYLSGSSIGTWWLTLDFHGGLTLLKWVLGLDNPNLAIPNPESTAGKTEEVALK